MIIKIEFLSDFAFVRPIKSKSAREISGHLLEYISIFGAPKIILSDQGTEFNNELVNELVKNIGVEHVVTAAYNP